MLKRDIDSFLIDWKSNPSRKPLIIEGARQVGKTYSVDAFAEANYKRYIRINFAENEQAKRIFDGDLDPSSILSSMSLYLSSNTSIIPGDTLIFLDEIQLCPRAITALKFLPEDKRFDVIASGSLLGLSYAEVPSFPVGHVNYAYMHPLSFKEYLVAKGIDDSLIEQLRNLYLNRKMVPEPIHQKMFEYLREYAVIGGMPEAVEDFVNKNDYSSARRIQKEILNGYRADIAKYAKGSEKAKARECFESIPAQLSRENKKFRYSEFDPKGSAYKYGGSVKWLIDSGTTLESKKSKALDLPYSGFAEEGYFKLYMADTGLLTSMLGEGAYLKILDGDLGIYKGAAYENLVAEMLSCNGHDLYFYSRNNTLELDFLLEKDGLPLPIEVKAGNNKAKSLSTILKERPELSGIKLVNGNVGYKGNLLSLPLYMAMFL